MKDNVKKTKKKKIKRANPRRIQSNLQTELFLDSSLPPRRPEEKETQTHFIDPDPNRLCWNNQLLGDYLEKYEEFEAIVVREYMDKLDLSAFETQYSGVGRVPYHPKLLLGLVLYGTMHGISSLRELEKIAAKDLGAIWVSGGIIPDHSTIGGFMHRHRETITKDFFENLTKNMLQEMGDIPTVWSGDGTVIASAANRFKTLTMEAARQQLERALEEEKREKLASPEELETPENVEVESEDESASEEEQRGNEVSAEDIIVASKSSKPKKKSYPSDVLKKALEVGEKREKERLKKQKTPEKAQVCLTDLDAGIIKHKRGHFGPGYVPSIVTAMRIILAIGVDSISEIRGLDQLFLQAKETTGLTKAHILMDKGYHSARVEKYASALGLTLLSPLRSASTRRYSKGDFERLDDGEGYQCPAGKLLKFSETRPNVSGGKTYVYRAAKEDCKGCAQREKCTLAQRRSLHISEDEQHFLNLGARMKEAENLELYKRRQGDVEPVFGALKEQQRLRRFRRRGLESVRMEFAVHACAHNLKQLVNRRRKAAREAALGLFLGRLFWFSLSHTRTEKRFRKIEMKSTYFCKLKSV